MEKRSKREKLRRYIVFVVSLFIMSFGVSMVTRSLTGTSPISSVPYVWSLHTVLSMGTYIIILNAVLIAFQILLLGFQGVREFKTELLMQIPVSLLFGVFIDITMSILSFWHPDMYALRMISCVAGCCFMALGIALEVVADVCMNSGEYVLHIASRKYHKDFGMMKILFDVSLIVIAVACSLIFAGRIDGVREGTVIVAVITGPLVRLIRPRLKFIDSWETAPSGAEEDAVFEMYGDGGHAVYHKNMS